MITRKCTLSILSFAFLLNLALFQPAIGQSIAEVRLFPDGVGYSEEEHVGFIAEEVPDLVATKERNGLSPMDIVAVLTKVVKEQQEAIDILQKRLASLEQQRAGENR